MSLKIVGECNCCGLCCATPDGKFVCENLEVSSIGNPNGTKCKVYNQRYPDMPIRVLHADDRSLAFNDNCVEFQVSLDRGNRLHLPAKCTLSLIGE